GSLPSLVLLLSRTSWPRRGTAQRSELTAPPLRCPSCSCYPLGLGWRRQSAFGWFSPLLLFRYSPSARRRGWPTHCEKRRRNALLPSTRPRQHHRRRPATRGGCATCPAPSFRRWSSCSA